MKYSFKPEHVRRAIRQAHAFGPVYHIPHGSKEQETVYGEEKSEETRKETLSRLLKTNDRRRRSGYV